MTKSENFISERVDYNSEQMAKIYLKEIEKMHGVPLSIFSYHGTISLPCFGGSLMINKARISLLVKPSFPIWMDKQRRLYKS